MNRIILFFSFLLIHTVLFGDCPAQKLQQLYGSESEGIESVEDKLTELLGAAVDASYVIFANNTNTPFYPSVWCSNAGQAQGSTELLQPCQVRTLYCNANLTQTPGVQIPGIGSFYDSRYTYFGKQRVLINITTINQAGAFGTIQCIQREEGDKIACSKSSSIYNQQPIALTIPGNFGPELCPLPSRAECSQSSNGNFPSGPWQKICTSWGWRWIGDQLYLTAECSGQYTTFNVTAYRNNIKNLCLFPCRTISGQLYFKSHLIN